MKKKRSVVFGIALTAIALFGMIKTSQAVIDPPSLDPGVTYYQAYRYCGSSIKLACTTKTTSSSCTRYACIVNY